MMAVETKQGGNVAGSAVPAPAPAVASNGQPRRRKRPSQLLAVASSLPSVETSLDEFIARANQTLVDVAEWGNVEKQAKQADDKRREADAHRWKAAEHQLREGDVREQALRRQLDGLQGRLAEAEARAAVAADGSQDAVMADLTLRLTRSDERARAAEDRANHLLQELSNRKSAPVIAAPVFAGDHAPHDHDELEARLRLAEAKAAKAIAAAKAAAAGLTVSAADIAAIESGLVVTTLDGAKATNWGAVVAAFLVGGAIMFAVSFVMLSGKDKAPRTAAAAPVEQPAPAAPAVVPAAKPIVTPIEDPAPPAVAAKPAPVEAPAQPEVVPEPPVVAKPAAPVAAKHHSAPAAPASAPAPRHTAAKAPKPAAGIADPFGGAEPTKKPAKPAKGNDKKPGAGIVDPF